MAFQLFLLKKMNLSKQNFYLRSYLFDVFLYLKFSQVINSYLAALNFRTSEPRNFFLLCDKCDLTILKMCYRVLQMEHYFLLLQL